MSFLRRTPVRIALFLTVLWLVMAVIVGVVSEDFGSAFGVAGTLLAVMFGIIGVVLIAASLPTLLPQIAFSILASRHRFQSPGLTLWGYRFAPAWTSQGLRWQLGRTASPYLFPPLLPHDDLDLRDRLIRVWGIAPLAAGASVLASIPLGVFLIETVEGHAAEGFFLLLAALFLMAQVSVLLSTIREDLRSPRSIVRLLRAGGVLADREVAATALNGYYSLGRQPRDYDEAIMRTTEEWIIESPTAHSYRYLLIRYLLDRGETAALLVQREAILRIEAHLRSEAPVSDAEVVLWYAAYGSDTAEELARIWGWSATSPPNLESALIWLRAREKELQGEYDEARSLAQQARQRYLDELVPGFSLDFEVEQLDGFLARLPREELEGEAVPPLPNA